MGVEATKQYAYSFKFGDEVEITENMRKNLVDGEEVLAAYKFTKETLGILTNKRIIYRGLLYGQTSPLIGKEIYMYTIPYSSIDFYASEYLDTTLINLLQHFTIWTKGGQQISLLFTKNVDMKKVRLIFANSIII